MFLKQKGLSAVASAKAGNATIAVSIVVAGALIAAALYFALGAQNGAVVDPNANQEELVKENLRLPDSTDYVLGDANAPIVLIEYADLECPACQYYAPLVREAYEHYNGEMAVVYRHFPLTSIHPQAQPEAEAAECVGELGGAEAYYTFVEHVFDVSPGNNGLDLSTLPELAAYAGVDKAAFTACYESGKHTEKVQNQYNEAIALGANGTPFSIIVVGDQRVPIGGAPNDAQSLISFIDSLRQ